MDCREAYRRVDGLCSESGVIGPGCLSSPVAERAKAWADVPEWPNYAVCAREALHHRPPGHFFPFFSSLAFFSLAQRAFCAAAIRARPAALSFRRFFGGAPTVPAPNGNAVAGTTAGRPRFARPLPLSESSCRTCSRHLSSSSIAARISEVCTFYSPSGHSIYTHGFDRPT